LRKGIAPLAQQILIFCGSCFLTYGERRATGTFLFEVVLCLFCLKIPRGFSMTLPLLCEFAIVMGVDSKQGEIRN